MEKVRMMKVRLTLSEDIDITPEVNEWLGSVQDKISKEYSEIEAEIKIRIASGLPIVFKDGKLVGVEDIMELPDITALNEVKNLGLVEASDEKAMNINSGISNSLMTGRKHD